MEDGYHCFTWYREKDKSGTAEELKHGKETTKKDAMRCIRSIMRSFDVKPTEVLDFIFKHGG